MRVVVEYLLYEKRVKEGGRMRMDREMGEEDAGGFGSVLEVFSMIW